MRAKKRAALVTSLVQSRDEPNKKASGTGQTPVARRPLRMSGAAVKPARRARKKSGPRAADATVPASEGAFYEKGAATAANFRPAHWHY
jgi:hypothetical protein